MVVFDKKFQALLEMLHTQAPPIEPIRGYSITLTSGQVDSGNDFGNYQQATKSGTKFHDLDADGTRDAGENGIVGWTIYAYEDDNGDGNLDLAEQSGDGAFSTVTGADGSYSFTLDPGKYIVVEDSVPNWFQSHPTSGDSRSAAAGKCAGRRWHACAPSGL